jgi:DMSO/TMAO reductase YedYZ molybdopterin-dependent catalytic subunit
VRNHFPVPALDPGSWSVRLTGSERSFAAGLALLRRLPSRTLSVVLECAGHRRTEFQPTPAGLPWGAGAVAEAVWTGVSLASVLELVGIPPEAHEVVLEGADAGPVEGFDGSHSFARSLPLGKALHPDVLLAYEMNGEPIPVARGGPIRAVVPGWYATDSVKWLKRIWFVNGEFDGVFQAHDYRLRAPDEPGPGRRMSDLPAHALITTPADGAFVVAGGGLWVRGTAWGGTDGIAAVLVQVDGGAWTPALLGPARGPYTRVEWKAHPPTDLPAEPDPPARAALAPGPHEIACCAIDRAGNRQPARPPANVRGYANNAIHRVRVQAV